VKGKKWREKALQNPIRRENEKRSEETSRRPPFRKSELSLFKTQQQQPLVDHLYIRRCGARPENARTEAGSSETKQTLRPQRILGCQPKASVHFVLEALPTHVCGFDDEIWKEGKGFTCRCKSGGDRRDR